MRRGAAAATLAALRDRERDVTLLRFLRIRGLFLKQVLSFFVSFVVVWSLVGFTDVYLSSARFKRDARQWLDRADFAAVPAAAAAEAGAGDCRARADRLFWRAVESGTRQISDFNELLAYFHDGRLHVQILADGRVACASAPAPRPLLLRAMQRNLAAGETQTLVSDDGEWALARRLRLSDGSQAMIGLNYWPDWATDTDYVIAYDLGRSLVYTFAVGAAFVALWMWLLLRRVRRATQAADRWAGGDFSTRIADASRDEFSALAERFNRMADALAKTMHVEKALGGSLERNRIARDLHDTAKQRSFVLGLKLTELEHDARGDARLLRTIDEARLLADRLQQDLIDAVSGFNAPAIAELGLNEALSRNIADLMTGAAIGWRLRLPPQLLRELNDRPAIAQELLMMTHEAVANARRHSGCGRIEVAAERVGARWHWRIGDDGHGFDPQRAPLGMGLANLRWRADQLPRGRLEIVSDAAGTRVIVSFDSDVADAGPAPETAR